MQKGSRKIHETLKLVYIDAGLTVKAGYTDSQ